MMAVTSAMIAKVKRMCGETGSSTYDADIAAAIASYPLLDERGEAPYTWDTATNPPTTDTNESWIVTYDLNSAAADIWEMKAAAVASDYDFSADGANYHRSQVYEQYMKMARRYRSRRAPKTVRARMEPPMRVTDAVWIGNTAEDDD